MSTMLRFISTASLLLQAGAFSPINVGSGSRVASRTTAIYSETTETTVPLTVGTKRTGISFLPEETIERSKKGGPIEKAKMQKDPMNGFVDVYDVARRIREGEMTWQEIEKVDINTVSKGTGRRTRQQQRWRER